MPPEEKMQVGLAWLKKGLQLEQEQSPFPWQEQLLKRFLEGKADGTIDIPTGLGKTAVIAIWLVARALGAPLPRRLVYIVDRRAVVDQATEVADWLRLMVEEEPELKQGLDLHRLLPISTLRGQHVDNREWLEDPASPAIVVGTVDMIGSRLLFEGYRASHKMRPYLAGMLGHDTLFVLDEAHLVPPFERLLERVILRPDQLGPSDPNALFVKPPPPRLLSLSATGRSRGGEPFGLSATDLLHPEVASRLGAIKRIQVESLDIKANLAEVAAERAWRLNSSTENPKRCIIFLSKREDAEKAHEHLTALSRLDRTKKAEQKPTDLELLVGGRRVHERVDAARWLGDRGFLAGTKARPDHPAFLIATSAGEVGIDLDADLMVADLVAWERIVQRLGRVNRRGKGDASVLILRPQLDSKATPAQIEQYDAVHDLIQRLPTYEDGSWNASPGALRELQTAGRNNAELAEKIQKASTLEPLYPELDRPTLEAWSMTSLREHPGRPAIAPWLRGWVEEQPQTSIVWRRHLPIMDGRIPSHDMVNRFFEAAPPHASELLETESFKASEWLAKRAKRLLARAKKDENAELKKNSPIAFSRLAGEDVWRYHLLEQLAEASKKDIDRALLGGELIVDARLGGLAQGLLNHTEDVLPPTLDCEDETWLDVLPFRIRKTTSATAIKDRDWRERERTPTKLNDDGEAIQWLVVEKHRHDSVTEDDRSAGRPQLLAEHQEWTANKAAEIAQRLALPEEAARLLTTAARLHDEGKRSERWQTAFCAERGRGPFAKTLGPINIRLLDGYRHEIGSLPYAERDPEVAALGQEDRDLVLHLIASHHGFARPVISTKSCDSEPPSVLKERARQIALRFARLQQQWGPWGLAWWEALLRAADQQASRENDRQEASGTSELSQ